MQWLSVHVYQVLLSAPSSKAFVDFYLPPPYHGSIAVDAAAVATREEKDANVCKEQ